MPTPVSDSEIDRNRHDAYLEVIGSYADPVGQAMQAVGHSAGTAARSLSIPDCAQAAAAMTTVCDRAAAFLDHLAVAHSPDYMRGADSQLQDALKLLVDAGRRGADAATARDGNQLTAAADEMNVATRDIVATAHRIAAWRSGAARP
jgi:hypothetical protein